MFEHGHDDKGDFVKISTLIRQRALGCLNLALAVGLCAALAKPLASDWLSHRLPTPTSQHVSASAGFSDLGSFVSSLGGLFSAFMNALNPFVESTVAGYEKASAADKELAQSGLNYDAALIAADTEQKAKDTVSSETSDACQVKAQTMQAVDAKSQETLMARALTGAHGRRDAYTASSSAEMQKLLASSMADYCSPDNKERGACSGAISPKNMPDGDIHAKTFLSSESVSSTMSEDEFEASSKYVSWATNPIPAEQLPIVLEKTPAGQRYLAEARRRQAITSSAQFALNRIIASRWEKK